MHCHPRCSFLFFVSLVLCGEPSAIAQEQVIPGVKLQANDLVGNPAEGLKPWFTFIRSRRDWDIGIMFLAQTNFSQNSWLLISNRVGARLRLWLTNGTELPVKTQDAIDAFHLPITTTASNMETHYWGHRPAQWLMFWGPKAGDWQQGASSRLRDTFGVPITNDVVLQITPLIYKVDLDPKILHVNRSENNVHLVTFPAIKMKLLSNGDVQRIDDKELPSTKSGG